MNQGILFKFLQMIIDYVYSEKHVLLCLVQFKKIIVAIIFWFNKFYDVSFFGKSKHFIKT